MPGVRLTQSQRRQVALALALALADSFPYAEIARRRSRPTITCEVSAQRRPHRLPGRPGHRAIERRTQRR